MGGRARAGLCCAVLCCVTYWTVLVRALGAHGAETLTAALAGFIAARNLAANDENNTRALGAAGISAGEGVGG